MAKSGPTGLAVLLALAGGAASSRPLAAGPGTWTLRGPYGGQIWTLAIDAAEPATIYAGTDLNGVFKSVDGGSSWVAASEGLENESGSPPGYSNALVVRDLAFMPGTAETLLAATGTGAFKTTDGGGSWSPLAKAQINVGTYSIAVVPTVPENIYLGTSVGVFKSTDGGENWELASNGLGEGIAGPVSVDPTAAETAYAVVLDGVYRTTDGGENWEKASVGLPTFLLNRDLAIDPVETATLYLATDGGVFKSVDGAGSWEALPVPTFWFASLALDPQDSSTVYAGSYLEGLYRSEDGGANWEPRPNGLTSLLVEDVVVDHQHPSILYAGTSGGGVHKSTDGAASWVQVNGGISGVQIESLTMDPVVPEVLYAGTPTSLFKTVDGGGSWFHADAGLPGDFVVDVAIDPGEPETLYAATFDGAFESANGGASWNVIEEFLGDFVRAVAVDAVAPCNVFVGGTGGLDVSHDCGELWAPSGPGGSVGMVEVDPSNSESVYTTVLFEGLYRSLDGGDNWELFNDGLVNVAVEALAFDPEEPKRLYAATRGGVYEMLLDGLFEDGFESGDTSAWDETTP